MTEEAMQTSPAYILKSQLKLYNMSKNLLSEKTGLTLKYINLVLKSQAKITHNAAIKLASVFSFPDFFWINLQKEYDSFKDSVTKI